MSKYSVVELKQLHYVMHFVMHYIINIKILSGVNGLMGSINYIFFTSCLFIYTPV